MALRLCSLLLPHGPHQGPFPALLPLFPVLLKVPAREPRPWEGAPGSGRAGQSHSAQEAAARPGVQRGAAAFSTAGCGVAGPDPFCLGSRIYILPTETSIFLGSNPSCHHCVDIAGFLTLHCLLTVVILVGPGPCIMLGSRRQGHNEWSGWALDPAALAPAASIPVVRNPGLLFVALRRADSGS